MHKHNTRNHVFLLFQIRRKGIRDIQVVHGPVPTLRAASERARRPPRSGDGLWPSTAGKTKAMRENANLLSPKPLCLPCSERNVAKAGLRLHKERRATLPPHPSRPHREVATRQPQGAAKAQTAPARQQNIRIKTRIRANLSACFIWGRWPKSPIHCVDCCSQFPHRPKHGWSTTVQEAQLRLTLIVDTIRLNRALAAMPVSQAATRPMDTTASEGGWRESGASSARPRPATTRKATATPP